MDPEDGGDVIFTAGTQYKVIRVHPMRDPPTAVVIDDTGTENWPAPNRCAINYP